MGYRRITTTDKILRGEMKEKGENNVVTFDPRPCANCSHVRTIRRDKLGPIYGCSYWARLHDAANNERRDEQGCGPSARNWRRKEKRT